MAEERPRKRPLEGALENPALKVARDGIREAAGGEETHASQNDSEDESAAQLASSAQEEEDNDDEEEEEEKEKEEEEEEYESESDLGDERAEAANFVGTSDDESEESEKEEDSNQSDQNAESHGDEYNEHSNQDGGSSDGGSSHSDEDVVELLDSSSDEETPNSTRAATAQRAMAAVSPRNRPSINESSDEENESDNVTVGGDDDDAPTQANDGEHDQATDAEESEGNEQGDSDTDDDGENDEANEDEGHDDEDTEVNDSDVNEVEEGDSENAENDDGRSADDETRYENRVKSDREDEDGSTEDEDSNESESDASRSIVERHRREIQEAGRVAAQRNAWFRQQQAQHADEDSDDSDVVELLSSSEDERDDAPVVAANAQVAAHTVEKELSASLEVSENEGDNDVVVESAHSVQSVAMDFVLGTPLTTQAQANKHIVSDPDLCRMNLVPMVCSTLVRTGALALLDNPSHVNDQLITAACGVQGPEGTSAPKKDDDVVRVGAVDMPALCAKIVRYLLPRVLVARVSNFLLLQSEDHLSTENMVTELRLRMALQSLFPRHDHLLNFDAAPPQHPPFLSQSRITSVLAQFTDAASWLDGSSVSKNSMSRTTAGQLLGQFLEHVAVTVVATARAISLARKTASCGAQAPPPQGLFESGLAHTFPSIRALDRSSIVSISVHDLLCAVAAECGSALLGPYPRFQRSSRRLSTDKLDTVSPLTSFFEVMASKTFFSTGTPASDSHHVLAMQLGRLLGPLASWPVPDHDSSDHIDSSPLLLVITRVADFLAPADICSLATTNFEMWRLCRGPKCGANGAWGTASQVRLRLLQGAPRDGYSLGNGWFWCLGQIARLEVPVKTHNLRKTRGKTLLDRQQHRAKLLDTMKAHAQQVCEEMASSLLSLRYGFRIVRLAALAQRLVAHVKGSSSQTCVRPFFLLHEGQLMEQGSVPGALATLLEHCTHSSAANWHRRLIPNTEIHAPLCTTTFVFEKNEQRTTGGLESCGSPSHTPLLTQFRQSFGGNSKRWRAWCRSRGVRTCDDNTGSAGVKNMLPVPADRKLWGLDSSALVHRAFSNSEQRQSVHATTTLFLETITATLANGDVLGVVCTSGEDALQTEKLDFEMQQRAAKLAAEKKKQTEAEEQQIDHQEHEQQAADQPEKQTAPAEQRDLVGTTKLDQTQPVFASGASDDGGFATTSATEARSGSSLLEPAVNSATIFASPTPFFGTPNNNSWSFSASTQEQSANDIFRVPNNTDEK